MRPFRLEMTGEIKERLLRFTTELIGWNKDVGLLSRQDVDNVVVKHIGASLGPLLAVDEGAEHRWVDVGTGAGLPGMVLKLWEPARDLVLIESARKRCIFLERIARLLDLDGISILPLRVETLLQRGEMVGEFRVLFARAVADLPTTLREFGPLLERGGQVITFKGPGWMEDVEKARGARLLESGEFQLEQVLRIPWSPGHLLTIRKLV
ncbi:MAG: 16S rRNA (guanine(527)-N(7))-methyltransferase RsmG [Candidatus Eisenbacteria bacterium]|nr:16S rRNA (guanine(527)-N(7))-methyltransferase RsmG [Candidatus Eisenbacteria bacterium]